MEDQVVLDKQAMSLVGLVEELVWQFGEQGVYSRCCTDLSHAEYRAARCAGAESACSMGRIAEALGVTKSGATRIIDRLEGKGYVKRMKNPKDGRVCCIQLTSSGQSLIAQVEGNLRARMRSILLKLGAAERRRVLEGLESLVTACAQVDAARNLGPTRSGRGTGS